MNYALKLVKNFYFPKMNQLQVLFLKVQYGAADSGFAAAGFTDKAKRFALIYRERYAVHGL